MRVMRGRSARFHVGPGVGTKSPLAEGSERDAELRCDEHENHRQTKRRRYCSRITIGNHCREV
jgi:hypothetical protein